MTTLALILPLLALAGAVPRPKSVMESLTLDNGLNRGEWGPIEICPEGSYAFAMEIKYSGTGYLDDTSVNAIRLFCQTPAGGLTGIIMSSEGTYGQWNGMRACPVGEFTIGVRANVVPDMGPLADDLGMDNLELRCAGGTVIDGLHEVPPKTGKGPLVTRKITEIGGREMEAVHMKIRQSAQVRDYGDWGAWRECSPGNKICGLEVRLEDDHVLDDDAGVTDAIMYCCN